MGRTVPHIFRDEILADRFEWHVVSFDKNAKKPQILRRTKAFDDAFRAFRGANPAMTVPEALHAWTRARLMPATNVEAKHPKLFPGSNFGSKALPALWIRSPIQAGGETNKVVGFPVPSPRYRKLGFQDPITDPDLLDAITPRVIHATLQPVSTFMNSVRDRLTFAKRAGGESSRSDGAYIKGAAFSPRVLIALLTIFRTHYNLFELRTCVNPINKHEETAYVQDGTTSLAAPGSDQRIEIPKRRRRASLKRLPAMRAGIHQVKADDESPRLPNRAKVLCRPWLFHGTPRWARLRS